jgi:hypothetical protein
MTIAPWKTRLLITTALVLGPSTAFAEWGTFEQAQVCAKEHVDSASWGDLHTWPYPVVVKLKKGAISAACKAEIQRRSLQCADNGEMIGIYRDTKDTHEGMTMADMCNYRAFAEILQQYQDDAWEKEQAAKAVKDEADAKAQREKERQDKLAVTEMPVATMKNPALEKAVAQAYMRDYPGNKVLKVILFGWDPDLEKDGFGQVTGRDMSATVVNKHDDGTCELHYELWLQNGHGRSFSGPLSARGAGSMETTEILCSKVEAAAAPAKAKKKH